MLGVHNSRSNWVRARYRAGGRTVGVFGAGGEDTDDRADRRVAGVEPGPAGRDRGVGGPAGTERAGAVRVRLPGRHRGAAGPGRDRSDVLAAAAPAADRRT